MPSGSHNSAHHSLLAICFTYSFIKRIVPMAQIGKPMVYCFISVELQLVLRQQTTGFWGEQVYIFSLTIIFPSKCTLSNKIFSSFPKYSDQGVLCYNGFYCRSVNKHQDFVVAGQVKKNHFKENLT